jgi:uncharacterized protein YhdP
LIGRLSHRLLRLLAVLVTALTVATALFAWRIASGPIALDWLTPYIADALGDRKEGIQVTVGATELRLSDDIDLVELVVVDVRARGRDGRILAELPEVELSLSLRALLRGMIAVARLEATAPHLVLVRRADGSIGLQGGADANQTGGRIELGPLVAALLRPPDPGARAAYFERLEVVGGRLTLADQLSGQRLEARDAELVLLRHVDGLGGNLAFALEQDGAPAAVHLAGRYDTASEWLRFDLDFDRLVPGTFASLAPEVPLAGIALPLTGRLQGGIKPDGERAPVDFKVTGGPGQVDLPDLLMAPLPVKAVVAEGELASDLEHLTVERFEASALAASLSGTAALSWPDRVFAASAEVEAQNVAAKDLGRFWPPEAADEARTWVLEHITDGIVPQAQATISIQPGDLAVRPLPEGIVEGRFTFDDLSVGYYKELPPLTGVDGSATFTARRMDFAIEAGRIGDIVLDGGSVVITGMGIPGRETTQLEVRTKADGPLRDVLALIDHPPLHLASKADVSPAEAAGKASIDLAIGMPLHRDVTDEEVRFRAGAKLTDAAVRTPSFALADGALNLEVDDAGFDLTGDALVEGIPLQIEVRGNFADDAPFERRYRAKGVVDVAAVGGLIGDLPLELSGTLGVDATMVETDGVREVEVALDLTPLALASPWLDWRKAEGEPGSLSASLVLAEDAPIEIQALALSAPGLEAQGSLQLRAEPLALEALRLERVRFGQTEGGDLTVRRGSDQVFEVNVAATTLDLNPVLDAAEQAQDDGPPEPLRLKVSAGRVLLADQELREVGADLVRDQQGWKSASIRGSLGEGGELQVTLEPSGDHRRLRVISADAGGLLQAIDKTSRISGGKLDLDAAVRQQYPSLDVGGTVRITSFTLRQAPLLARLLTVASLTGIGNLLAGEGIYFDRFEMPFTYRQEVLAVDRVRLSGSQLGLTAKGTIDLGRDRIDLSGTIVPIYGLNWVIGRIPVLGDFLRGSEGEGAFAMTYSASGDLKDPSIRVNPLSVLAPGMIRELFSGIFWGTAEPPVVGRGTE